MKKRYNAASSSHRMRLALVSSLVILNACSSSDDNDDCNLPASAVSLAFVSSATPSVDAGQIERLAIGDTVTSTCAYPATESDIRVRTDGESVYELGRLNLDTLTKYAVDELTTPIYQYSVLDEGETSANPHDLVFVSSDKAYLIHYESEAVWIVNPNAETEAEFKIGELDLSAYDIDAPEATDALIVDDRLYILMQRLESFQPVKPGYVAVFDTSDDSEIDTGLGSDGLSGIALNSLNPSSLEYLADTDEILVLGRGNIFVEFNELPGDPYQGGIESISEENGSYTLDLLLDDGTEAQNNGFFSDAIAVNSSRGYVVTYEGFQNTSLRSYNPTLGTLDDGVVAELENVDITTLAIGPLGRLWVGRGGNTPGFTLINPDDNSVVGEPVTTEFVPNSIVFTDIPDEN